MTALVLRLFDCVAWLLRGLGVDYPQFRAILQTKLTLDARRPRGGIAPQHAAKSNRNLLVIVLLSYAFVGLFFSMILIQARVPLVGLTIVHAALMVMIALSLLGDYSTVLLDTTDNRILLPRPVGRRTILFARLAHILTYLFLITLSLSAATFVVGTFMYGRVFPVAFAFTLVLSVGLVVGAVSLAYLLGMRLIPQDKLRDVITYAQIAMTVVFVAGYQLVPQLIAPALKGDVRLAERSWIYFCPPTWMAGPIDLALGQHGVAQVVLSIEAMAAPIVMLLLVAVLAPSFKPGALEGEERRAGQNGKAVRRRRWLPLISRLLTRPGAERGAFELTWRLVSRDRQYKLRVYPMLAFVFVFAFVWMFTAPGAAERSGLAGLGKTDKHLILLYFVSMVAMPAILHLRFSNQPEAAWIYRALPLEHPGEVLSGGLRVVVARLVGPTFAVASASVLAVWGWRALPDVLLALAATLLICVVLALMVGRHLPFSESAGALQESGRSLRSVLFLPMMLVLGGVHLLIRPYPVVVLSLAAVLWLLVWSLARRCRQTPWSAVPALQT